MLFITAKFRILPEHADRWPEITRSFTRTTREEPGCVSFEWSRSLDDPTEYVLIEAFRDDDAWTAHLRSEHFGTAHRTTLGYIAQPPRFVRAVLPQDDWSVLDESPTGSTGSTGSTGNED